jgi:predicted lipid-binding transport protein (Tim44 family)
LCATAIRAGSAIVVIVQTLFAPKLIVPLAYDSGGVTTSTVTVPLVAGLGLGLAEAVPGRSPLIDGFGLIAFASLFPIITVLAYAQASEWRAARARSRRERDSGDPIPSEEQRV